MTSLLSSIFGKQKQAKISTSLELFNEQAHHHPAPPNTEESLTFYGPKPQAVTDDSNHPSKRQKRDQDEKEQKEEQDRQDRLTVFVGNLPLEMTRKQLASLFASCGKVVTTRIRSAAISPVKVSRARDPALVKKAAVLTGKLDATIKASVHGYIVFETHDAVLKALELNNTKLADDSDRRIRVDTAVPSWMQNTTRAVFVGNLPFDDCADGETTLQQHFAKHCSCEEPEIEAVRIIRDKQTFASKGFGYVLFNSSALQATALRCVPGTKYRDRELRVMPCRKEKRKHSSEQQQSVDKDSNKSSKDRPQKVYGGSDSNAGDEKAKAVGALRRLLSKDEKVNNKKKRARGTPKMAPHKSGASKKKAKADKQVHKMIQNKVDKEKSLRKRK